MATQLPAGVVTFLFSDIEASTRLLYRLGDEDVLALVERHRVVMRAAFAAHCGHEVSTEGDSFFVVFERASDAVRAALDAQSAFAREGFTDAGVRVRMGLHTGEALVAEGDYYGLAVHQAARIAAAAHGGQVLVSATTGSQVDGALPEGASFEDLGEHRLRDLESPHQLLQLRHRDLTSDFPPPRSLQLVTHNLPVQTSSFVGRDTELAEVAKLLATSRLVSLLGPGGTGKTRLAYQAAANAVEDFGGGIWVVELALVNDQGMVPSALLHALGQREEPDRDPTDTVVAYLRDRQALIIVDNCEHVIGSVATLSEALLRGCPMLRVLSTSREALRVSGEVTYQVPGLGLPSADRPDHLDGLADAVRLFVARAIDVHPGFTFSADNAPDIGAICTRLDGLPLAIELAASRARSLSPGELNNRLSHGLDLLSKGARNAEARQATLRGAIEWSHELLNDVEQVLFRRLAVFTGGWTLDAAEQICSAGNVAAGVVLDTLDALVDKSLVAVGDDEAGGERRYWLLQTIGDYAAERLALADETEMLADRHAAWCSALASEASAYPDGSREQVAWFDRLDADHANLLASLEHLRRRGDAVELEVASQLCGFWLFRGHWQVARAQLRAALVHDAYPSLSRANVLVSLGHIAWNQGQYLEARTRIEEALAIARELGDRRTEAKSVGNLGLIASRQGDYLEARARYEETRGIARELGDRRTEAKSVGNLGLIASRQGDYLEARARAEEALAIARELGDRRLEGVWVGNLGDIASRQGDYPEARARSEKALAIARELGDRRLEGAWVGALGFIAGMQGDYPEARARAEEALAIARELGDRRHEGVWVGNLGFIASRQGHYPEARARYEEALAISRALDAPELLVDTVDHVARLLGAVGRYRDAVELFAWADEARRETELARSKPDQEAADKVIADARGALAAEALRHARTLGVSHSNTEIRDVAEDMLMTITTDGT